MILVCGEALMDVFALADTATGTQLDARIGGSPLNVAIALARLRQPSAFFGALSSGFLGDRLLRALLDEGVDTRHVVRTPAPTTLGLVGLDAAGVPSYSFYGEGGADRQLDAGALRSVDSAQLRAVHVGSYATVVEPIASTLRALIERVRGLESAPRTTIASSAPRGDLSSPAEPDLLRGEGGPGGAAGRALIAYDPNIRLNVEPDLARWRDQLEWMLPRCDLLKISAEDLELLLPGRSHADFAAFALARGTAALIVTRGAGGAAVWTSNATADSPAVAVQVIDTVGAGDTFQAALLTWLAERGALSRAALAQFDAAAWSDALGFAARAAAITCSRRGADMPRRGELN